MPGLLFSGPSPPFSLLGARAASGTRAVCRPIRSVVYLLSTHTLSTYKAKVSAPGFSLHGNRSRRCSWKRWLQEPCRLACIYVFQRQKWLRWFVSWELLMESAKLGMCQLFNFHCYLQKWSFELRENVPSAYPCDNAWFYSQAYQPLAWHFN